MNIVNVLAKVKKTYEVAMKDENIKKPISYALYNTWKWADAYEHEKKPKTRRRENKKEIEREVS